MIRFPILALGVTTFLAACSPIGMTDIAQRRVPMNVEALPPMKMFATARPTAPTRANKALATDFVELSFMMESGRQLTRMTRFDEPVSINVIGSAPPTLHKDLDRLLTRLRTEAKIDIRKVKGTANANISVNVLPRKELQRVVPQAACFVVPNVTTWSEFKRMRRTKAVDWALLTRRTKAAIFLPGDVSPQEIRDCLHEEVAQALGPLNDVYRLPDSVFNDDNFHTVLTGFDMMMLRAYYSPQLSNGMTKSQVAQRLPGILAQINPQGQRSVRNTSVVTPRRWIDAIETAVGPKTNLTTRRTEIKRAVAIAESAGWADTRTGFALYIQGRLSLLREPELALGSFLDAAAIYRSRPETAIQGAHVAMQLAAFSLSAGQVGRAVSLVNENLPAVSKAENAALLATLLMIKAEALDFMGQSSEASTVRLDSLGWARYGFGPDEVVRARLNEIAALTPRRNLIVGGGS